MKVFNLTALSLGFSFLVIYGLCYVSELVAGELGIFIAIAPAMIIGMNARRIMEKILGYTMDEALKNDKS